MKKALLTVAVLALSAGSLFAQDLVGTWQGTLAGPQPLRVVFKITKADTGALQGTMYAIDQNSPGIAIGTITVQGSSVTFQVPRISGSYEGKIGSDRGAITGSWSQGGPSIPLTLTRATPATAWSIPEPPAPVKPMAADANPAFEVVSIKPTAPGTQGKGFIVRGRTFATANTSLADMITFAYGVHVKQIIDAPAWAETEMYNLTGEPDAPGQPSIDQWKAMLQKALAERFKLAFHHEKRELSVYAIVVGKTGPKLTREDSSPNGVPGLIFRGLGNLPATNATMVDFANVMQSAVMDRPVVDQTGLTGRWDFTLKWTPDETQFRGLGVTVPTPKDDPNAPPTLFTAIQEELGLRLDSTKADVDVLVVDAVERPTTD